MLRSRAGGLRLHRISPMAAASGAGAAGKAHSSLALAFATGAFPRRYQQQSAANCVQSGRDRTPSGTFASSGGESGCLGPGGFERDRVRRGREVCGRLGECTFEAVFESSLLTSQNARRVTFIDAPAISTQYSVMFPGFVGRSEFAGLCSTSTQQYLQYLRFEELEEKALMESLQGLFNYAVRVFLKSQLPPFCRKSSSMYDSSTHSCLSRPCSLDQL